MRKIISCLTTLCIALSATAWQKILPPEAKNASEKKVSNPNPSSKKSRKTPPSKQAKATDANQTSQPAETGCHITSDIAGVELLLDGIPVGRVPLHLSKSLRGEHTLSIPNTMGYTMEDTSVYFTDSVKNINLSLNTAEPDYAFTSVVIPSYSNPDQLPAWGYSIYERNGKKGVRGYDGQILVPAQFSDVKSMFLQDFAAFVVKNIVSGIELAGVYQPGKGLIIPCNYDDIEIHKFRNDSEAQFIVKRNGNYGVIDSNNKQIIPLSFSNIKPEDRYYICEKNVSGTKTYSLYNEIGTEQLDNMTRIYEISSYLARVKNPYGKEGMMDLLRDQFFPLPNQYTWGCNPTTDKIMGYIVGSGNQWTLAPIQDMETGLYGYALHDGEEGIMTIAIAPQYTEASPFFDGVGAAKVSNHGQEHIINIWGNVLETLGTKYKSIDYLLEKDSYDYHVAKKHNDGKTSIVDKFDHVILTLPSDNLSAVAVIGDIVKVKNKKTGLYGFYSLSKRKKLYDCIFGYGSSDSYSSKGSSKNDVGIQHLRYCLSKSINDDAWASQRLIPLNLGDRYGLMSSLTGEIILPLNYSMITPPVGDVIYVRDLYGQWTKLPIDFLFNLAMSYREDISYEEKDRYMREIEKLLSEAEMGVKQAQAGKKEAEQKMTTINNEFDNRISYYNKRQPELMLELTQLEQEIHDIATKISNLSDDIAKREEKLGKLSGKFGLLKDKMVKKVTGKRTAEEELDADKYRLKQYLEKQNQLKTKYDNAFSLQAKYVEEIVSLTKEHQQMVSDASEACKDPIYNERAALRTLDEMKELFRAYSERYE